MTLAKEIASAITRWNVHAVEPTCVVMGWDVVDSLAAEHTDEMVIGRDPWRIWGLPIVIVDGLPTGTWSIGTDRPVDADRIRVA